MEHPELALDNPPPTQLPDSPVDAPEHWRRFPNIGAPDLAAEKVLFSELVPGGGHWSYVLPRGVTLRITALEDGANLSLVLY